MYKSPLPRQKNLICMVHLPLLPLQALVPTVDEVSSMFSRSEGFMMLSGHFPKVGGTVSGTNNKEMESIVPCPHLQVISEDGMLVKVSVTLWTVHKPPCCITALPSSRWRTRHWGIQQWRQPGNSPGRNRSKCTSSYRCRNVLFSCCRPRALRLQS
jgi:hypothetical protein